MNVEVAGLTLTIVLAIIGATAYTSRSIGRLNAKMDSLFESTTNLWKAFSQHRSRNDSMHDALNDDLQEIRGQVGRLQGKVGNGTYAG